MLETYNLLQFVTISHSWLNLFLKVVTFPPLYIPYFNRIHILTDQWSGHKTSESKELGTDILQEKLGHYRSFLLENGQFLNMILGRLIVKLQL